MLALKSYVSALFMVLLLNFCNQNYAYGMLQIKTIQAMDHIGNALKNLKPIRGVCEARALKYQKARQLKAQAPKMTPQIFFQKNSEINLAQFLFWASPFGLEQCVESQNIPSALYDPKTSLPSEEELYVVGDPHGDINAILFPLVASGIASIDPAHPTKVIHVQTGEEIFPAPHPLLLGQHLLIPRVNFLTPAQGAPSQRRVLILGDLMDRGLNCPEVLYLTHDLLKRQPPHKPFQVILGNHELEILRNEPQFYVATKMAPLKLSFESAKAKLRQMLVEGNLPATYAHRGMLYAHSFIHPDLNPDLAHYFGQQRRSWPPIKPRSLGKKTPFTNDDVDYQAVAELLNKMVLEEIEAPSFPRTPDTQWLFTNRENGLFWARPDTLERKSVPLRMGVGHTITGPVQSSRDLSRKALPFRELNPMVMGFDTAQSMFYHHNFSLPTMGLVQKDGSLTQHRLNPRCLKLLNLLP